MIGNKIEPILLELEDLMWDCDEKNIKVNYTNNGTRAIIKIFMNMISDQMCNLQIKENISKEDSMKMAQIAGNELRTYIKKFTDIDTFKLYETS